MGVGKSLEGCESLRTDDEQGFCWIEIPCGFREIGAVDIRDKAECDIPLAIMAQRFVGHHWAEVGATDTDVDDIANTLTGIPLPFAAADSM